MGRYLSVTVPLFSMQGRSASLWFDYAEKMFVFSEVNDPGRGDAILLRQMFKWHVAASGTGINKQEIIFFVFFVGFDSGWFNLV